MTLSSPRHAMGVADEPSAHPSKGYPMSRTVQEEVRHFLSDMYSVELQALTQMKDAPSLAKDEAFAGDFRRHTQETEGHAERVRRRLEQLGGSASSVKDAIMTLGGKGFLLFARAMPETPGRLAAHAYSYEAMEWAGYEALKRLAERAGDGETAALAASIQAEERAMMSRLEQDFDLAERASHPVIPPDEMPEQLRKHLAEAHAIERQSIELLERSVKITRSRELASLYGAHLDQTRRQAERLETRLHQLGGDRSMFKDAALALGGLNWSLFFAAQSDTPIKLAAFAYAVEHLEIAAYELLLRTARRAHDDQTQLLCREIIGEERAMSGQIESSFDAAVQETLEGLR